MTASGIAAAITGPTAAYSFLSSAGLLAGSFLTNSASFGIATAVNSMTLFSAAGTAGRTGVNGSTSAAALSNAGTAGLTVMTGGTLVTGSVLTVSATFAALQESATAGASLVNSFTTASIGALTAAGVGTAAATLATIGIPSFRYNGSAAMTTAATDASYLGGPFIAALVSTGSWMNSIDLKATAITVTGSAALAQPWFAMAGLP